MRLQDPLFHFLNEGPHNHLVSPWHPASWSIHKGFNLLKERILSAFVETVPRPHHIGE